MVIWIFCSDTDTLLVLMSISTVIFSKSETAMLSIIDASWYDQTSKTVISKTLAGFCSLYFGDFHSQGCYQSPLMSYTRRAGKAFQHKNSSPERRWIHQAKYCSWVLGVQCLECSAYTAHPILFLVHSLLCNINMRPMCAGDTLSRCRKDIFAEPSQICCCCLGMIQFLVLFLLYLLFQSNS